MKKLEIYLHAAGLVMSKGLHQHKKILVEDRELKIEFEGREEADV